MMLRTPAVLSLTLLALGCESPGSGGTGGKVPITITQGDTQQSTDGATNNDTSITDPVDDVVSPSDTGPSTTNNPDVVTGTCDPFPLTGTVSEFSNGGEGTWSSPQANVVGGASPDVAALSFESNQTGTFSLGGQTPDSCTRCLSFYVDVGTATQQFFATEGNIEVSAPPFSLLDVSLTSVRLSEVDEDGDVVSGGSCYTINQLRLTGEGEQCEPSCGGKQCGNDGCGGSCGTCSGTQTCNGSGVCTGGTPGACTTLAPTGDLEASSANVFGLDISGLNLGGAGFDVFIAEFYTEDLGNFSLTSGINSNYATCEQCLRVFEDDDARQYFQTAGSINIDGDLTAGLIAITMTGVELREVTVADDFETTLVAGGKCYKISNRTLSTP